MIHDDLTTDLNKALDLLHKGDLIGLPTETVYGLAGDARRDHTLAQIYAQKGRPTFNPLIIHGHSAQMLSEYIIMSDDAQRLAEHFWPGPLTLVLPRKESGSISLLASAGLPTLAVRVPSHPVAQALLKAFDGPLAAPSANLSNQLSPTTSEMVRHDFPDLYVLEGGQCPIGLESTIIGFEPDPVVYRLGGMDVQHIQDVLGRPLARPNTASSSSPVAPGMLKKHYAPKARLRLNADAPREGELFLGFGVWEEAHSPHPLFNLSVSGCTIEAASRLFSVLFQMDQYIQAWNQAHAHLPLQGIAVAPIPDTGLGPAINDRLSRGAA